MRKAVPERFRRARNPQSCGFRLARNRTRPVPRAIGRSAWCSQAAAWPGPGYRSFRTIARAHRQRGRGESSELAQRRAAAGERPRRAERQHGDAGRHRAGRHCREAAIPGMATASTRGCGVAAAPGGRRPERRFGGVERRRGIGSMRRGIGADGEDEHPSRKRSRTERESGRTHTMESRSKERALVLGISRDSCKKSKL